MTGRRFHRTIEIIPALPWSSKGPSVSTPIKQSTKTKGDAWGASEVRRRTSSVHFHCPAPRSSSQSFAVSCGFLRTSAPPKCSNSQEKRKSAKICEKLRIWLCLSHLVCLFYFPLKLLPKHQIKISVIWVFLFSQRS